MLLQFRIKQKPSRDHVKQWLSVNTDGFPVDVPNDIGQPLFHGWRFIRGLDGIVYFANCIDRGITEAEVKKYAEV
jgi:hypothetical protein